MTQTSVDCIVCNSSETELVFSARGVGFTLAQKPNNMARTQARLCLNCSHMQTPPVAHIDQYYDDDYGFQLHDAEEDDIYAVLPNGKTVFRAQHQAFGVLEKHDLKAGQRVLDYGCGKARSLAFIMDSIPDVVPFTYDVSDAYTGLWDRFVPAENQAPYTLPADWQGTMDLVLSFFALEHAPDAQGFVRDLRLMLRPDGRVHVVIPNMYRNISDLVVVDHVHHFSAASLHRLFAQGGFENIDIDDQIHRAAFVVTAQRSAQQPSAAEHPKATGQQIEAAKTIAAKWDDITTRIAAFEAQHQGEPAIIYGSGVYGSYIASSLSDLSHVAGFLDANPFRQGRQLMGLPIFAPDQVPGDVRVVYVGLNPQDAPKIIEDVPALHQPKRSFFFL